MTLTALEIAAVVGFAPAVAWLVYFYRKDKFEPEPKGLVIRTFFLGIVAAVAAGLVEDALPHVVRMPPRSGLGAIVVAPIVEETAKFLVVFLTVYRSPEFDEPVDGLIYAAAAALGFAAMENVGYVLLAELSPKGNVAGLAVSRAILSVPGHALMSTIWGAALGWARFTTREKARPIILGGLLLAMGSHAAFNTLCLFNAIFGWAWIVLWIFFFRGLWPNFKRNVAKALACSPHSIAAPSAEPSAGDEKLLTSPHVPTPSNQRRRQ